MNSDTTFSWHRLVHGANRCAIPFHVLDSRIGWCQLASANASYVSSKLVALVCSLLRVIRFRCVGCA